MDFTREEILEIIAELEENILLGDDVFKSELALEWYRKDLEEMDKHIAKEDI